jgi:cytoskeletal protein CcmA (bactofilin family)
VVFRRDSKVDAFQRQISALRHQLGGDPDDSARSGMDLVALPRDDFGRWDDLARIEPAPRAASQPPADFAPDLPGYDTHGAIAPAVPAIDELTSVISHTTTWSGNLDSTGSLHVHGRVEGALTARDSIFVAEEAEVDAVIQAAVVTIAGNVRGTINCSSRFELLPRGRVSGDVRAPIVVIHQGAIISGEIAMSGDADAHRASRPLSRAARS